jgi:hypothetical protein
VCLYVCLYVYLYVCLCVCVCVFEWWNDVVRQQPLVVTTTTLIRVCLSVLCQIGGRGNVVVIERPDENDPSHMDDIVIEVTLSYMTHCVTVMMYCGIPRRID